MNEHFDWRENQRISGVAINPGTEPVHNTSHENAVANIKQFIVDLNTDADIDLCDTSNEDEGRYTFVLKYQGRKSEIDMPGIPLENVRYLGPSQNIWDYPRLYENGSSWVWCFALNQTNESLFGDSDNQE